MVIHSPQDRWNKNVDRVEEKNSYSIISHGGIGDEHWEDAMREKQKHNLSGSCHELRIRINWEVLKILIDVWAYQGRWKLDRNIKEIAQWVSAIILTHPHMDHIGDFPRVFADGSDFKGRVFASPGTLHASEIALIDAAKILQRDYDKRFIWWEKTIEEVAGAMRVIKDVANQTWKKRVPRRSNWNRISQTWDIPDRAWDLQEALEILKKCGINITPNMQNEWLSEMKARKPEKPAYNIEDVYTALSAIEKHDINNGWNELVPGQVAFRFYNAWHIIWSVSVLFRITHQKKSKYVLFSWDLGSYKWDIHPTWIPIPPYNLPIDTVMIESTYWAKVRENFDIGFEDFKRQLMEDVKKYRRITISTFAMDRTQNILARLIKMKNDWDIDADIILDSPAGNRHTQAYVKNTVNVDNLLILPKAKSIKNILWTDFEARERSLLEEFWAYINPANGYYQVADKNNRWELFGDSGKVKIVVTASGMADGGMVIEHLQKNIADPNTVFYFPGYLVPWTLWYALANESQPWWQQKKVLIEWKSYVVKARMKQFNFLSGHGDAEDLRAWLWAIKFPKGANIIVVHGDVMGSSLEFKHSLIRHGGYSDKNIIVPGIEEENSFPLDVTESKKWAKIIKNSRWPLAVMPSLQRANSGYGGEKTKNENSLVKKAKKSKPAKKI